MRAFSFSPSRSRTRTHTLSCVKTRVCFACARRHPGTEYKNSRIPSYCDRILWKSMPQRAGAVKQTLFTGACEARTCPSLELSDPLAKHWTSLVHPLSLFTTSFGQFLLSLFTHASYARSTRLSPFVRVFVVTSACTTDGARRTRVATFEHMCSNDHSGIVKCSF